MEVVTAKEVAEVEVTSEVATADAVKEDQRKSMATRVVLFMWERNTHGRSVRRTQRARILKEVICNSNRAEAEVVSLLQEADLAVAVDTAAVEEATIINNQTAIMQVVKDQSHHKDQWRHMIHMSTIRRRLVTLAAVQQHYHHHLNRVIKATITNINIRAEDVDVGEV